MAAVPLALVLVAAVVVPLALIPGNFGFHSWPKATEAQVSDRAVAVDPVPVHGLASARSAASSQASRPPVTAPPAPDRASGGTLVAGVRRSAPAPPAPRRDAERAPSAAADPQPEATPAPVPAAPAPTPAPAAPAPPLVQAGPTPDIEIPLKENPAPAPLPAAPAVDDEQDPGKQHGHGHDHGRWAPWRPLEERR